MITARKAKHLDATTMFTYSHPNTRLAQSERAYYLSYFINGDVGLCMPVYGYVWLCMAMYAYVCHLCPEMHAMAKMAKNRQPLAI